MSDTPLTQKKCTPCEGGVEPYSRDEAEGFMGQVAKWDLSDDERSISRLFVTKHFTEAVRFINAVKDVAEEDNHHPDIHLTGYRKLLIEISTHKIGGLSENDFILAAKINALPVDLKE